MEDKTVRLPGLFREEVRYVTEYRGFPKFRFASDNSLYYFGFPLCHERHGA